MTIWDADNILALCYVEGLRGNKIVLATAICRAESGFNDHAVGVNHAPGYPWDRSRDRGLWQINDYFHSNYSDACCFNPACNATAMMTISSGGSNWHPWSSYNAGSYRQFVKAIQSVFNGGEWQTLVPKWNQIAGKGGPAPPHPQADPPMDSKSKMVHTGDQLHSVGAPVAKSIDAIESLFR